MKLWTNLAVLKMIKKTVTNRTLFHVKFDDLSSNDIRFHVTGLMMVSPHKLMVTLNLTLGVHMPVRELCLITWDRVYSTMLSKVRILISCT